MYDAITNPRRTASRRAFTLIELLAGIAVLILLLALLIVGIRYANRAARRNADTAAVASIKQAVTQFREQMGFLPPLVQDGDFPRNPPFSNPHPIDAVTRQPVVYSVSADQAILRNRPPAPAGYVDPRYSDYSLAYYIVGALGEESDGVDGPGFLEPNPDGSFPRRATPTSPLPRVRRFDPLLDVGRNSKSLAWINDPRVPGSAVDTREGRIELRDNNGVPIRYYRWLQGRFDPSVGRHVVETPSDLNIPVLVGVDPANTAHAGWLPVPRDRNIDENPALRDAEYAIVAAGPNRIFGDEDIDTIRAELGISSGISDAQARRMAAEDNIVEVGR